MNTVQWLFLALCCTSVSNLELLVNNSFCEWRSMNTVLWHSVSTLTHLWIVFLLSSKKLLKPVVFCVGPANESVNLTTTDVIFNRQHDISQSLANFEVDFPLYPHNFLYFFNQDFGLVRYWLYSEFYNNIYRYHWMHVPKPNDSPPFHQVIKLIEEANQEYPFFTLVFDSSSTGFVFHLDKSLNTYVMYEMFLNIDPFNSKFSYNFHFKKKNSTPVFYLELTNSSNHFLFRHSNRLFTTVPKNYRNRIIFENYPHGFIIESRMYLFDTKRDCVYSFERPKELNRSLLVRFVGTAIGNFLGCSSNPKSNAKCQPKLPHGIKYIELIENDSSIEFTLPASHHISSSQFMYTVLLFLLLAFFGSICLVYRHHDIPIHTITTNNTPTSNK